MSKSILFLLNLYFLLTISKHGSFEVEYSLSMFLTFPQDLSPHLPYTSTPIHFFSQWMYLSLHHWAFNFPSLHFSIYQPSTMSFAMGHKPDNWSSSSVIVLFVVGICIVLKVGNRSLRGQHFIWFNISYWSPGCKPY